MDKACQAPKPTGAQRSLITNIAFQAIADDRVATCDSQHPPREMDFPLRWRPRTNRASVTIAREMDRHDGLASVADDWLSGVARL